MDAVGARLPGRCRGAPLTSSGAGRGRPRLGRQRQELLVGDPLAAHLQPVDAGGRELRGTSVARRGPERASGLLMASRRGIIERIATCATQEEIEIVQPPDEVEKTEGGDQRRGSRR